MATALEITGDIVADNIGAGSTSTGSNTGDESSATTSAQGIVELALTTEATTGTDTTRAVTPDALEDKLYGTFTGSTISDNGTLKAALQELETSLETMTGVSAIITETTTSRTLVVADGDNKYIRCTNVALTTITIPTNASVAFAIGTEIDFIAESDKVDFSHAGVTLNEPQGLSDYIVVTIKKIATDEWDALGST